MGELPLAVNLQATASPTGVGTRLALPIFPSDPLSTGCRRRSYPGSVRTGTLASPSVRRSACSASRCAASTPRRGGERGRGSSCTSRLTAWRLDARELPARARGDRVRAVGLGVGAATSGGAVRGRGRRAAGAAAAAARGGRGGGGVRGVAVFAGAPRAPGPGPVGAGARASRVGKRDGPTPAAPTRAPRVAKRPATGGTSRTVRPTAAGPADPRGGWGASAASHARPAVRAAALVRRPRPTRPA